MTKFYRQNAACMPLTLSAACTPYVEIVELSDHLKMHYPDFRTYLSPDYQVHNFFGIEVSRPVAEKILDHMAIHPDFARKQIDNLEKAAMELEAKGEKMLASTAGKASMEDQFRAFNDFFLDYAQVWRTSLFLDMLDMFETEITDFIFGSKKNTISRDDFQALMTPTRSIYRQEQIDRAAISQAVRKNPGPLAADLLLRQHAQKYWWIQNDYQVARKLQAKDFAAMDTGAAYHDPLAAIEKAKPGLIAKYLLDKKAQNRLEQFMDLAYLRDLRKKNTQIGCFFFIEFFHTIARNHHVPEALADFLVLSDEYNRFIRNDASLLPVLEKRRTEGVWILVDSTAEKGHFRILTDGAKAMYHELDQQFSGNQMVYGRPASLGKAMGKAKIVLRQADFGKFNPGDILIAGMTRPEYVPLMKKAGAIVTDEGGITCHAAIVSRELGVPCIVGTQIATKIFKDNDWLEVNANHGTVSKIEKENQ